MNPGNFFAELKRRNVYKVAVAYLVAGWALAQGVAQVLPVFEISNWIIRLLVLLMILGLPIALVLAWMFELTPEGIKRTETADAMPEILKKKNYLWVYVVVIGAFASTGLFFLGRYSVPSREIDTGGVPRKSIAVLPFESLSEDKSNAYFAEGVQEEILTRLAKVADLKVISRTSTQKFKSAPEDLRKIAKQLGVTNILEGSVQKAGDQVRVNVQLINALTGAHLWADTYDRRLTDIFSVETGIANSVADTLQAKLTGSEKSSMAKVPTSNSEAYEFYLKGRFFWNKRTGTDLRKAIDYFNEAIAKDPNYALAYAGLADAYLILPNYGAASAAEALPPARIAAKKALELDNTLAEAHASMGLLACLEFDFERSIEELERAIQLNPNYSTAHHWLSCVPLNGLGLWERAIAEGKRAIELDPLSLICNADLGWVYFNARRFEEAEAQDRKALEIDPSFYVAHYYLGQALTFQDRMTEALAEFQKSVELNDDAYSLAILGYGYARNGQSDEARQILARLFEAAKSQFVPHYGFVLIFTALGDKERAIDELEASYREGGNYLLTIKVDPMIDPLRSDPRFEELLQKIISEKE